MKFEKTIFIRARLKVCLSKQLKSYKPIDIKVQWLITGFILIPFEKSSCTLTLPGKADYFFQEYKMKSRQFLQWYRNV